MPFDSLNPASDDVLNMAAQAGYLPVADPNASQPVTGVTSPSMESGSPYPQRADEAPAGPSPGQGLIPPGSSVSGKYSGTSPAKFNQIRGATSPTLQRDLNAADASAQAEGADQASAFGKARSEGVQAQADLAKAHVDATKEEGIQAAFLGKIQDGFAAKEAQINETERGESNKAKADYVAALADLRASRVDPSQLWSNMSGGQRFGTLVTAFAQDFLGARGVHTSAMETFNKAIDRNIESQIQAIKTKGDVAEGFKSLWYMQRNQSSSDQEARTRVRGFLLEGAKQAVASHMAQYQAGLASAQGQAAIAALDNEFAKNLVDVYSHVDANSNARRQQAITIWGDQLKASLESQANSIAQQRLDMDKKAQQPNPMAGLMFDPETGKAIGQFRPDLDKTEMTKYREGEVAVKDSMAATKELRELIHAGTITPDMLKGTRFQNTDQQRYDAIVHRLAHSWVKANGERATDADVADYLKGIPTDTWLSRQNTDKVLADTQTSMIGNFRNSYSTYGYDLPKDDPRRGVTQGQEQPFQGALGDAKNTLNPPPESHETMVRKDAEKNLGGPTSEGASGALAREKVPVVSSDLAKDHERFRKEYGSTVDLPGQEKSIELPGTDASGNKHSIVTRDVNPKALKVGSDPEKWEQSMTQLKEIVQNDNASAEDRQGAKDQLIHQALNIKVDSADPTALYAIMMLHDLGVENVPSSSAEDLSPTVHTTANETAPAAKRKK